MDLAGVLGCFEGFWGIWSGFLEFLGREKSGVIEDLPKYGVCGVDMCIL